jgi:hypothetical protein
MNDLVQMWRNLHSQLEIVSQQGTQNSSGDDPLCFEKPTEVVLPYGFEEFCQVFGSGAFGDFIDIYCKIPERPQAAIEYQKQSLARMRSSSFYSSISFDSHENLLNAAFCFGGTSRSETLLWDLRTYDATDKSYDIYFVRLDNPYAYLVGRDFIRFVRDFCLGKAAYEVLPEGLYPNPGEIRPTFYQFCPYVG